MSRSVLKLVFLATLVVGGWVAMFVYEHRGTSTEAQLAQVTEQYRQAKEQAEQLRQVVQHLQAEQRVAEILVTRQWNEGGVLKSELLFQEYAKDNSAILPKRFVITGNMAHIDAMVIRFQGKFVENRDPLRGHSIALFTRLFDETTSPEKGYVIDDPGHIPAIYRGAAPAVDSFERQLWQDFWKLADDKDYRQRMGVDVTEGKSVWYPFEPGNLYTLTLQSDADLVLRYEPLKPIYKEMLKKDQEKPL